MSILKKQEKAQDREKPGTLFGTGLTRHNRHEQNRHPENGNVNAFLRSDTPAHGFLSFFWNRHPQRAGKTTETNERCGQGKMGGNEENSR
jgi:hypothetical protein